MVGDAFGGLAVPWHLTTTEFLSEVTRVLRPGGMYVANIIDYPPLRFVRAEAAMLATAFTKVASSPTAGSSRARVAAISCSSGATHLSTGQGWRPRSRPGGRGSRRRFLRRLTR